MPRLSDSVWDDIRTIRGANVCDRNGETIGTVEGVFSEGDNDQNRYLSIATGWFGAREHVVPLDDVDYIAEEQLVMLPYGRDQLDSAPTYESPRDLTDTDEESIYSHYGREGYWEAVRAKQTTPSATPEIAQADIAAQADRQSSELDSDEQARVGRPMGSRHVRRRDW